MKSLFFVIALQVYIAAVAGDCNGGQICTEVTTGRMQSFDLGFCQRYNVCGNTKNCKCDTTRTGPPPYIFQQGDSGILSSYYHYQTDYNTLRFDNAAATTLSRTVHLSGTLPLVQYDTTLDDNLIRFSATVVAESVGFAFSPIRGGYVPRVGVSTEIRFPFRVTVSGMYTIRLSESQCPNGPNPPPNPRPVQALGNRDPADDPPIDCQGHYGISSAKLTYFDPNELRSKDIRLLANRSSSEAKTIEQVYLEKNLSYRLNLYTVVFGIRGDNPWTFEISKS